MNMLYQQPQQTECKLTTAAVRRLASVLVSCVGLLLVMSRFEFDTDKRLMNSSSVSHSKLCYYLEVV